jgi:TetR/AcrR family transcriptional regulator, cholesterol catabolism regulator
MAQPKADNGGRGAQKEATRRRVLDAAFDLFESEGYEETTVRAIARRAGVSVGSVFTSFTSKAQILSEVMEARRGGLYAEFDRVLPHLRGSTADRLRSMFAIHYAFEAPQRRLFLAHIASAYSWTPELNSRPFGQSERLTAMLRDCLADGVERGDVDPEADLDLIVEMLLAIYGWSYRLVSWREASTKELSALMDRQIGLLAEGFRPQPRR